MGMGMKLWGLGGDGKINGNKVGMEQNKNSRNEVGKGTGYFTM